MKYDVFISYSRKDLEFAKKVCAMFDTYKQFYEFEYFFDMDEIKSRHEYLKRISTAISESKVMLFLASANSTKSEFCTKELLFADKHKVFIHQYRIDNTELPKEIDLLLGNHHYREVANFSIENMVREVLSDALKQNVASISELETSKKYTSAALVRVESDTKCRVLRFGREFAVIDKGISELHLPKGKQKLSFVSIESDADRFDYMLDIRDFEYEEYIEVTLLNKCDTLKLEKPKEESGTANAIIDAEVDVAVSLNPIVAAPYIDFAYKAYKTLKNINQSPEQIEKAESIPAKTYKVGDYYDDGKKQGVVFEVSADGKHGKIVSLEESIALTWSSETPRCIGTDSKHDGAYNMAKVKQIADWREKYPAFAWCADLGEDWYLPAIEELKLFTLNGEIRDAINRTLSQVKDKKSAPITDYYGYWSSTEAFWFCAWLVDMGIGDTYYDDKSLNPYVRAVSAF